MKQYEHFIIKAARETLESRKDRSAWDKAVTADALELLETVNDVACETSKKFAETVEGGSAHVETLLNDRDALTAAMLNGARDWSEYSCGGCALVYDGDIAEHYCTPSELKKTRNGDRRPNAREDWLDVQARALSQAARRARVAIADALKKTYTIKGV